MSDESCPRCGASLRVETRGELHDKVLSCTHCAFERDVMDEVTIHTKEAGKEVTIHRKDLGPSTHDGPPRDPVALEAKARAMMGDQMGDMVRDAMAGGTETSKIVTHVSTTTHNLGGKDAQAQLAEMGIDLSQLTAGAHSHVTTVDPQPSRSWKRIALVLVIVFVLLAVLLFIGGVLVSLGLSNLNR